MAGWLVACQNSPHLDHREVSPQLKAQLAANSRAVGTREDRGDRLRFDVSIAKNGPVSLPMTLRDGMPMVPASLNHTANIPFLVDTGSQGCVLEARTAVKHDVTVLDSAAIMTTLGGTTGREQAMIGLPDEFSLGSWIMQRFPFFVRTHETRVRFSWWEQQNIGLDLVGTNAILKSCDYLTLDFPGKRVLFGIGGRFPAPKGKGVWKAPLLMREGLPHVQLHTNGRTWTALVDSGFNGLLDMDKATAQRLQILAKARPTDALRFGLGAPVQGEPSQYGMVLLSQLDSLGPRMSNIPTLIVPARSKIGCALLRPFRVTLDFRRNLLWLEDPQPTT